MSPFLIATCLALLPTALPPWYAGRHAVLVIVDGVGEAGLANLRQQQAMPGVEQRFANAGAGPLPAASLWPGRGAVDDTCVAVSALQPAPWPVGVAQDADAWPPGSFMRFGFDDGKGLAALHAALPAVGSQELPPLVAVVRETALLEALAAPGDLRRAAAQLDARLTAVAARYQALGVGDDTVTTLLFPGDVGRVTRRLDAGKLLRELLPRQAKRSQKLNDLLGTMDRAHVVSEGAVAFAALRPVDNGAALPPTVAQLGALNGLDAQRLKATLQALARASGVALVVAREAAAGDAAQAFLLLGPRGSVRLEVAAGPQYRLLEVKGTEPLGLAALLPEGDVGHFHAGPIWRALESPWRDALFRVTALMAARPDAALALVADSGASFDGSAVVARADGHATVLWSGIARSTEAPPTLRSLEALPTLLALVGAPLSPALAGEPDATVVEAQAMPIVGGLGAALWLQGAAAFDDTAPELTVIDTTELRRFGAPPPYFAALRAALVAEAPASYLPAEGLVAQVGPRRGLHMVADRLAARVEQLVLQQAPNEIRRFDPLLRSQLMLTGFLDDPLRRARLRIAEGPRLAATSTSTPSSAPSTLP